LGSPEPPGSDVELMLLQQNPHVWQLSRAIRRSRIDGAEQGGDLRSTVAADSLRHVGVDVERDVDP